MTHRRQMLAVLAGCLLVTAWASGASAHAASHAAQHQVVVDSTTYQSEQQLLANTQVMVVAKVEAVGIDRSAPASQPASLVTLRVHDVLRGPMGQQLVVLQPRTTRSRAGHGVQAQLQTGKTYLLLLARAPGTKSFFLVGGNAGEFSYNGRTKRFTKIDTSAPWEDSGFALSLAKAGAEAFPESTPPSWLTSPGAPGSQAVSWSSMANDLGLNPTDVTCPSESVCLFAGDVSPQNPGVVVPAVAVSAGPFSPQASVVGTTTTFPPSSGVSSSFVACSGPDLCVLSSPDGISVTTDPSAAHWTLEVAPSPQYAFGQVSCPTVSFCAVASGSGVLVTRSPSSGSSAWDYIGLGPEGFQAVSCPSPELCVAGGSGDATVGGWIATSTDPLAPASWHGGPTPHPSFAQHSNQYNVSGISCPTTAFCVAAVEGGAPLTSTNPAGGVKTWTLAANGSMDNPGFATCTTGRQCSVSGVGSFVAQAEAPGPGITGYPLPGVSCVAINFCVTVTDGQLAVGRGTG